MDRYAVMGNPIAHSKSPMIHTLFAQQTSESLTYEAILVPLESFSSAVRAFQKDGGKGLNVTVPFKTEAWQLSNRYSDFAHRAGAVNTLEFSSSGEIVGHNTDGIGIVRDIQNNIGYSITAKRILVLGAGGAVRGILEPFLELSPECICIANRTESRARELVNEFSRSSMQAYSFENIPVENFDIVINGTSASLQGELPPVPVKCVEGALCYDMMYGKQDTPFMQWSRNHGAPAVKDGLGMLVEQAAEAFYIWRKKRPQTASVINAVRQSLV
ncbi:MAG: shikimate dehydrogenase [Gammaproteobacteria bacterium]|nr:shikimate dehydrogenase [Gammaproteobacteria bacterium]